MSRIAALDPVQATGKTQELLEGVQAMLGGKPNLFRVAARSASVLDALVGMFVATGKGRLGAKRRESLALVVAEVNGCDYCLSAHTALGKGAGLSADEMDQARDASAPDAKTAAILRFARALVVERGQVSEDARRDLQGAGVTEEETLEIVAVVTLNIFTNYLNLVAGTDVDFPLVEARKPAR